MNETNNEKITCSICFKKINKKKAIYGNLPGFPGSIGWLCKECLQEPVK
jgi:poly(A) polymerase Pap1